MRKLFVMSLIAMVAGYTIIARAIDRPDTKTTGSSEDAQWQSIMDFFIQDVCLDAKGNVVMGVSPVDNNPECVSHRDLKPGERLSYYNVMTLPERERAKAPNGLVRGANFPYQFPKLPGISVLRLFDSQANGAKYGVRDYGDSAIRTLWVQSPETIGYGAVDDQTGPTLYDGPNCISNVTDPEARYDAGVTVDRTILKKKSNTYEGLAPHRSWLPAPCTSLRAHTKIEWKLEEVSYTTGFGAKRTQPLLSLISQVVPRDIQTHDERTYYTRELGYTRHESWEKLVGRSAAETASLKSRAAKLEHSGACIDLSGKPDDLQMAPPPGPGDWVTVGCFESTNILPPDDSVHGDYPQAWIDRLKESSLFAPLFGVKPQQTAPVISQVQPSPSKPGDSVVIKGSNFGVQNTVQLDYGGAFLSKVIASTDGGTKIEFVVPLNIKPGTYHLCVYNDDLVGYSESVAFVIGR